MLGYQARLEHEAGCQETEGNWKEAAKPAPHASILDPFPKFAYWNHAWLGLLGSCRVSGAPHLVFEMYQTSVLHRPGHLNLRLVPISLFLLRLIGQDDVLGGGLAGNHRMCDLIVRQGP
jgi:hypothetical protein